MLVLDDGETLTENIAILSWIADQVPELAPIDPLGRARQLEALAFIATELHKSFKPLFKHEASDTERANAGKLIALRLAFVGENLDTDYLLGANFTAADAYLFVILVWARHFGVTIPEPLDLYFQRLMTRASVHQALAEEGLNMKPSLVG